MDEDKKIILGLFQDVKDNKKTPEEAYQKLEELVEEKDES